MKINLKRYEGHTPGPWIVDNPNWEMVQIDREPYAYICDCDGGSHEQVLPDKEIKANARLIADSPAILAAYVERGRLIEQLKTELVGANSLVSEIERMFPGWESCRDLADCIAVRMKVAALEAPDGH